MTVEWSVKVQVNIIILDYIKEIMDWFEQVEPKYSSTKSSAAPLNLFVVDEDCDKLRK